MKRSMIAVMSVVAVLFIAGMASADQFWGSASVPWGNAGPVLFKLDTSTGTVGTTYTYSDWSYIMAATYAPGNILYAVHNNTGTAADLYNFKMAKINATTGAVLSDTPVANFSGTDYPQWNAMEYHNGKIYAVENSTAASYHATKYPDWNGTANGNRGHVYEVGLNGSGDPTSVTLGAYIGGYPAPDGALAYRDGTWYASDWRTDHSSWIAKTTDVMNTNFTETISSTAQDYGHLQRMRSFR